MKQAYPTILAGLLFLTGPAATQAQTCTPATVTTFPYTESFDGVTAPNIPCGLTVADVNTDGSTWATIGFNASSGRNAIRYSYNDNNNGDDWFFTPALRCRAGATYQVEFKYRATLESLPEALEVRLGTSTTPSVPLTTLLFSNYNITNTTYVTSSAGTGPGQVASFTPATTDIYYVSFRAVSPARKFYLYLDDVSITESAPLPVQLTGFAAQVTESDAVRLSWTTASELHSAYFAVERSFDGISFTAVGEVRAAGNSVTTRAYAFTDDDLPAATGPLYYRLRQVDLDGTTSFSSVRSVALLSAGLAFYPNPAAGSTTFTCARATTLTVRDALGRVCLGLSLPAGAQRVDLTALPPGSYTVTDEATLRTLRLLKQP